MINSPIAPATNPLNSPIEGQRKLRQVVYARLKQAIVEGQLAPGEHLVEDKIAERLGVSRNPVREALHRLEQEQLAAASAKGLVVSSISRTSIEEIYAIRAVLEALGCRLASKKITPEEKKQLRQILARSKECVALNDIPGLTACDIEFHDALIAASRNQTMKKVLDQLRDSVRRLRIISTGLPGRPKQLLSDHTAIANAVFDGNGARAQKLVHDHILQAARVLLANVKDEIR